MNSMPAVGRDERARDSYARSFSTVPLALVVLSLLGSLAIPARQTWLITNLLHRTTQVLAPSRLLVEQLQSNVANELSELQSYALSGKPSWRSSYRALASDDTHRLKALEQLSSDFDPPVAGQVRTLATQLDQWHRLIDESIERGGSRTPTPDELSAANVWADSSLQTIAQLSSAMAAVSAARDRKLRSLEHLSIVSNAALVLTALVAVGGVAVLTLRERRLTQTLRRRVSEESKLREAAAALAGAYTLDDLTTRFAECALQAVGGCGAYLQWIERSVGVSPSVVVRATSGNGVPSVGTTFPLAGSYTEEATTRGDVMLIADTPSAASSPASDTNFEMGASTIVIPVVRAGMAIGAMFIVSLAEDRFGTDDVERARILGHLAMLAYENVQLLEETRDRQLALERALQSRARLIRGFSHDVKNPINAADGFAELLSVGVYGELSAAQQLSVDRMRRNMQRAMSLIDYLHDLSRAETGNVALSRAPLNLAALMRSLEEEYDAAAQARGLRLSTELSEDGPIVETDQARVRQIAANLVSNAIKYTEHGTITLRTRRHPTTGLDASESWAALEVEDSGIGIPADKQEFIFEEFSRLGTSDRAGAGLGLAISKLLAEGLGGRISVASEPGRGSTFTLWLPCCVDALGDVGAVNQTVS